MAIPQVSTGCCGHSLRTASLIIAWFFTILVGVVWSLYLSLLPTIYSAFAKGGDATPEQGVSSIIGMVLTYFFIEHCLLLWGVLKKQHYFILPWLVMTCLVIAIGICGSAISFIIILVHSPVAFMYFIPNSIISSSLIYSLLVISSYYQEITKENLRTENSVI